MQSLCPTEAETQPDPEPQRQRPLHRIRERVFSDEVFNGSPSTHEVDLEELYNKELGVVDTAIASDSQHIRNVKQQISALKNRARLPRRTDALQQWQETKISNPDLYKLATTVLAVPSSQVTVERAFSALALVLTYLRTSLKKDSLENILIVKLNYDLMKKVNMD